MSYMTDAMGSMAAQTYQKTEKSDTSNKVVKSAAGNTIGNPKLSDTAAAYYEELKKKYSGMEFILVSDNKKAEAQANAGRYARPDKTVVLISEEKVERMAVDMEYRRQYENILTNSSSQLARMKENLGTAAESVRGYGIQVNDNGTVSYFAVVDKSLAMQKSRIEKQAAKKAEAKKEAAKEAAEKKQETQSKKAEKEEHVRDAVTVTATTMEELMQKIQDLLYADVQTPQEAALGQHIDFRG